MFLFESLPNDLPRIININGEPHTIPAPSTSKIIYPDFSKETIKFSNGTTVHRSELDIIATPQMSEVKILSFINSRKIETILLENKEIQKHPRFSDVYVINKNLLASLDKLQSAGFVRLDFIDTEDNFAIVHQNYYSKYQHLSSSYWQSKNNELITQIRTLRDQYDKVKES